MLAGGSNLAFGIDSAVIQNTFHIPVVNISLHAGFGLGRILDDISPFLHSGDILLIAPEYSYFTGTGTWNGSQEAYELIFNAHQFRLLLSSKYELPKGFSSYFSSIKKINFDRRIPLTPSPYGRNGFNEYGDHVAHLTRENKPFTPYGNSGAINQKYLDYFFQFVDEFTTRGITVVLSYPPFEEQSWRNSAGTIAELDAAFRLKENLFVISKPEDYCFATGFFYDTAYHLNREGRAMRTEQIINDLEASGLLDKYGGR